MQKLHRCNEEEKISFTMEALQSKIHETEQFKATRVPNVFQYFPWEINRTYFLIATQTTTC